MEHVEVAHCDKCGGIVKPDIVFFGENLPERFFSYSLQVPFGKYEVDKLCEN